MGHYLIEIACACLWWFPQLLTLDDIVGTCVERFHQVHVRLGQVIEMQ